jgi:hypothetical protein
VDPKLFYKTIVPILSMKNTALLCLSSPADDSNYYSSLMGLKKANGDDFFNVVNCFQICEPCRKLPREKQIYCTHVKSTTPWLSQRKINDLKALYKNSPEDAIREFGGLVMSDHLPALRKEEVELAFSQDRVTTMSPPKYIFTSCDPTGGGPSQLALCSGYYNVFGDFIVKFYLLMYSCSAHSTSDRTYSIMFPAPNEAVSAFSYNSARCRRKRSKCAT